MSKLPRLRCPVCGMYCYLRNLIKGLRHNLDICVVHYEGNRKIRWEKQPLPEHYIDYWIDKLEEVIDWLKGLKKTRRTVDITYPVRSPNLILERKFYDASVTYALPRTESKSSSTRTLTLNVPKRSVGISYETKT
jgi:hypothetical protein